MFEIPNQLESMLQIYHQTTPISTAPEWGFFASEEGVFASLFWPKVNSTQTIKFNMESKVPSGGSFMTSGSLNPSQATQTVDENDVQPPIKKQKIAESAEDPDWYKSIVNQNCSSVQLQTKSEPLDRSNPTEPTKEKLVISDEESSAQTEPTEELDSSKIIDLLQMVVKNSATETPKPKTVTNSIQPIQKNFSRKIPNLSAAKVEELINQSVETAQVINDDHLQAGVINPKIKMAYTCPVCAKVFYTKATMETFIKKFSKFSKNFQIFFMLAPS